MLTLDELLEKIADTYDPDLIVDVLEITSEELLACFDYKVEQNRFKFKDLENYE
jgi:hypothetical protein|tara:strand:- start:419 stop:580 length:162 start_codon:yes stop_codon:yes gene_type:complete